MPTETIIWTALPNGISPTGKLRLSVLVTPRLGANEMNPPRVLSAYPRFRHWPTQAVTFTVQFGNATPIPATVVSPARQAAAWEALVGDTTPVIPFVFDPFTRAKVASYPASQVRDLLLLRYGLILGRSLTEHPTPYGLFFGQVCMPTGHTTEICLPEDDALFPHPSEEPVEPTPLFGDIHDPDGGFPYSYRFASILDSQRAIAATRESPSPAQVLIQAQWFHERNGSGQPPMPLPPPETLDIHQIVSLLGDYPEVLRRVGLLWDLEVDRPADAATTVQVVPTWLRDRPDITPKTRFQIGPTSFLAAPRVTAPRLQEGMLRLDPRDFDVVEVDTDGSALKLLDFIGHKEAFRPDGSPFVVDGNNVSLKPTESVPVPSLRSGGLSLSELDRAVGLVDATTRNAAMDADGSNAELDAEDLTTGYVVDVWDDTAQRWYQLCARTGTITFTNTDATLTVADEGPVSEGATRPPGADPNLLCLHESLFRWTGWSLVAPRPGRYLAADPPGALSGSSAPPVPATRSIALDATYRAQPGTLPRLRYGRTYRFRCRALDLAGHAVAFDRDGPPVELLASVDRTYGRLEPIESPTVALRAPTTEAESVERLVLRSNFDTPPGPSPQRHLVPPKVSEEMVELCGAVDTPTGLDRSRYALLAQLDEGSLSPGSGTDPGTGQPYFAGAALPLPYAPDPMARGVTFVSLPGAPVDEDGFELPVQVPFGSGDPWPDALPFRMVVVSGNGAPVFTPAGRVLTVAVPAGVTRVVRYSCYLNEVDLTKLTLVQWGRRLPLLGERDGLTIGDEQLIVAGRAWMITPYREMTLVHAVRQPVTPPRFATLTASRELGETVATLADTGMAVHRPSTVRVDIEASWSEPIDALGEDGPRTVTGADHAGRVPIEDDVHHDDPGDPLPFSLKHVFADTKHRNVRYSAVGTSRYTEYFRQHTTVALTEAGVSIAAGKSIVAGSEVVTDVPTPPPEQPPRPPPGQLVPPPVPVPATPAYRRDVDYLVDYAAGTLRLADASTIPAGQTVAVSYVPTPVTRSSDEVEMPPRLVNVLSSSRPVAARPVQVVPTFGWSRTANVSATSSVRQGGGLRVYLERPWFSTGEGEQLGVLLATPGADLEALAPYVTRWGNDPVWLGGPFTSSPNAADFVRAVRPPAAPVGLAEQPGASVLVAPHDVGYDLDRRLWYCDIEVSPRSSYFPFVRLALARYQRDSVLGVELSTAVIADFAQLAPDRSATVVFDGSDARKLHVTVTGQSYRWHDDTQAGGQIAGPARIVVSVETKIAGMDGDLAWQPAKGVNEFTLRGVLLATGKPATWTGDVILPNARGSKPFRLVIREYEQYRTVAGGAADAGRLVYADVLEV